MRERAATRRGEFRGKHHDERFGVDRTAKPECDEQAARNDAVAHFDRLPCRRGERQRRLLVHRHHDAFGQQGAVDRSGCARARRLQGRHRLYRDEQGRSTSSIRSRSSSSRRSAQATTDKDKIQTEISALQKQLKSFADSATFSGANWLSVNSTVAAGNPSAGTHADATDRFLLQPRCCGQRFARQDQHRSSRS